MKLQQRAMQLSMEVIPDQNHDLYIYPCDYNLAGFPPSSAMFIYLLARVLLPQSPLTRLCQRIELNAQKDGIITTRIQGCYRRFC
jgi:hypothetical protein